MALAMCVMPQDLSRINIKCNITQFSPVTCTRYFEKRFLVGMQYLLSLLDRNASSYHQLVQY